MRQVLRQRLPSHGVFGEEGGLEAGAGEWTWVLDPIDGTKSFITGSLPAVAPATQREKPIISWRAAKPELLRAQGSRSSERLFPWWPPAASLC